MRTDDPHPANLRPHPTTIPGWGPTQWHQPRDRLEPRGHPGSGPRTQVGEQPGRSAKVAVAAGEVLAARAPQVVPTSLLPDQRIERDRLEPGRHTFSRPSYLADDRAGACFASASRSALAVVHAVQPVTHPGTSHWYSARAPASATHRREDSSGRSRTSRRRWRRRRRAAAPTRTECPPSSRTSLPGSPAIYVEALLGGAASEAVGVRRVWRCPRRPAPARRRQEGCAVQEGARRYSSPTPGRQRRIHRRRDPRDAATAWRAVMWPGGSRRCGPGHRRGRPISVQYRRCDVTEDGVPSR